MTRAFALSAFFCSALLTRAPEPVPPPDPHVLLREAQGADSPESAAVLTYNAGWEAGQQGNWNMACEAFQRFLTLPAPPRLARDGAFNYAVALARADRRAEAITAFKALLRADPADQEARADLEWLLQQEPPEPPPPPDQPPPPTPQPNPAPVPSPAGGPSASRPYTPQEARNMLQRMPPPRIAPPQAPEDPPRNLRPY